MRLVRTLVRVWGFKRSLFAGGKMVPQMGPPCTMQKLTKKYPNCENHYKKCIQNGTFFISKRYLSEKRYLFQKRTFSKKYRNVPFLRCLFKMVPYWNRLPYSKRYLFKRYLLTFLKKVPFLEKGTFLRKRYLFEKKVLFWEKGSSLRKTYCFEI